MADLDSALREVTDAVNGRLAEVFRARSGLSRIDAEIAERVRYLPDAGGKRFRPAILLWSCEALGGSASEALESAVALELLHTYSLVHDDMVDGDKERRGKAALHERWSDKEAIFTGDLQLQMALACALADDLRRHPEGLGGSDSVAEVLCREHTDMLRGQFMDLWFESPTAQVSLAEYTEMVRCKTGSLFRAAAVAGAVVAGAPEPEREAMRAYGDELGIAFQMRDDCLELVDDSAAPSSDLLRGKKTIVTVHFLAHADPTEIDDFRRVFGIGQAAAEEEAEGRRRVTGDDSRRAVRLLHARGSVAYAEREASAHCAAAKQALDGLRPSPARELLLAAAERAAARSN